MIFWEDWIFKMRDTLREHLSKIATDRQTALRKKLGDKKYRELMGSYRKGKKSKAKKLTSTQE